MSHTPTPWTLDGDETTISDEGESTICDTALSNQMHGADVANARRIIACVNACATMKDPEKEISDLRSGQLPDYGMAEWYESAKKQRDTYRDLCGELLNALKDLEKRAGYMAHCCGFFTDDVIELVAARSSITKAAAVIGENSNG